MVRLFCRHNQDGEAGELMLSGYYLKNLRVSLVKIYGMLSVCIDIPAACGNLILSHGSKVEGYMI